MKNLAPISIIALSLLLAGLLVYWQFQLMDIRVPQAPDPSKVEEDRSSDHSLENEETFAPVQSAFHLPEAGRPVRMLFFGDLMLDRHVRTLVERRGFDHLLSEIDAVFWEGYDLIGANLEGAVTDEGRHYPPQNIYDFAFDPKTVGRLSDYNFNYFSLANNHILDQGQKGYEETKSNLEALGFSYSGCAQGGYGDCAYTMIEAEGYRFALLSLNNLSAALADNETRDFFGPLKELSDRIIVNIHWGDEYQTSPNARQQRLARQLIEAGADLIIGHHPHVVQTTEEYRGKMIYYSLGNFIFDQYFSAATQQGLAVEVIFEEDNIKTVEHHLASEQSRVRLK